MDGYEFAFQYQSIHAEMCLVAASIVKDGTEAEDIVQEAAVIALRKRDTFEIGTNFTAWVTQIVRYCAANHNRKSNRRRTLAMDPAKLDQHEYEPSAKRPSFAGQSDLESTIDDAVLRGLSQLTTNARACLTFRADGLSYAEIGDLLAIPVGTAVSHVYRSREKLRRCLGCRSPSKVADE